MLTKLEYQRRNLEIVALRTGGMKWVDIARRYGLSSTRIAGIVNRWQWQQRKRIQKEALAAEFKNWQAELRVQETQRPPIDPNIVRGRKLARCFALTLPLIENAAKKASRDNEVLKIVQSRYDIGEDRAWTVMLLEREHKRQLNREVHREAYGPPFRERTYKSRSQAELQAELQEAAKKLHWTEVVYRSGTNTIISLQRRPWEV